MKLFLYAVVFRPTKKESEDGTGKPEIVVPLALCLAADEAGARTQAAFAIPEKYRGMTDRLEVAVRPF